MAISLRQGTDHSWNEAFCNIKNRGKTPQACYFEEKSNAVQVHQRKDTNKEFPLLKINFAEEINVLKYEVLFQASHWEERDLE